MESIKIKNREIKLSEIKKFTKIKNGIYSIIETNGNVIKSFMMKMDIADAAMKILSERDNESQSASQVSDTPITKSASKIDGTDINKAIERIEKNFGSFLDVEYKDSNLVGYWESSEGIPKRLALGYTFSRPDDLLDFEAQFADIKFGLESNPDGYIKRGDLTLMHTTREIKEAILKHHYNNRSKTHLVNGYQEAY
mgnify:CR=1 FL=1